MRAIKTSLAGLAILGTCVIGVLGQPPAVQEKPAAVINGEAIPMAEVRAVLDLRPSPVVLTAAQQREMRQAALDMLRRALLPRA